MNLDNPSPKTLQALLARQRAAFTSQPFPSLSQRRARLKNLRAAMVRHQDLLCTAMSHDFGGRSGVESKLADVLGLIMEIDHTLHKIRRWMKPQTRQTELLFRINNAWVEYQPKGVVGVIAPWNFPCYLAVGPLIAAIAAGNRVMLKMSEFTPQTTQALRHVLYEVFDESEVCVLGGAVDVGKAFSAMAFDHIVFTGSTTVGREVMRAAAEHLVPVTLELGGKSPAIVSRSTALRDAASKIAHGKAFNSGQICVSPDYALVPSEKISAFADEVKAAFRRMYPNGATQDSEYTSIVTPHHADRIHSLLADAKAQGAQVIACEDIAPGRRIPLHLVLGVTPTMRIAREELFGPILPIIPYEHFDDVVKYVLREPRPLAMYYFGYDKTESARLRRETHAGGMSINDWGWHVFQNDLPFGGIGGSGMGSYHGVEGFRTLSHAKSVFNERHMFPVHLFHPPYGNFAQRLTFWFYLRNKT